MLQDATKTILRGKIIALDIYIKEDEKSSSQ